MLTASLDAPASTQPSFICAKTRRGIHEIPLESIFYFIADQKYVTVVHAAGEHLIEQSLKELEQQFCDNLLRCHRDTLINRHYLLGLERTDDGQHVLRLACCTHTPHVSRRHLAHIKSCLQLSEA